eukprot:CAMPEP_0174259328 /NCGR_PEP_ID=MMETSP0439-20130205/8157_1 /TAXON_ID=0 /ORGANISM="Stereomyxa ramosa, Strain Chinc5" /LENGTH=2029 /DNA_ID=CAMNT_0015343159 /DNA_START=203 /DNA_END=6292 /DNA_ORIENTATION=-
MGEDAVDKLYQRLPEMKGTDSGRPFNLREDSLKPPKANTVEVTFPAKTQMEAPVEGDDVDDAPLTIQRFMPEGEISVGSHMSITFSHDMVTIGALDDVNAQDIGVKLDPLPEGRFRWVGTKTLIFEPKEQFPFSTKYTVTVPKGTSSVQGNDLQDEFSFTFSTATVAVKRKADYTDINFPDQKPLILVFNQVVEPEEVLHKLVLKKAEDDGVVDCKVRLLEAADEELVKSLTEKLNQSVAPTLQEQIKREKDGTWVAVVVTDLAPGIEYSLSLGKDLGSPEGPLKTTEEQHVGKFTTKSDLELTSFDDNPAPYSHWYFSFNNVLDFDAMFPNEDSDGKDLVSIEPPFDDMNVVCSHSSLTISGKNKGATTYSVTFSSKIVDLFGSHLEEKTVEITTKEAEAQIQSFNRRTTYVLDPFSEKTYNVVSVNVPAIRVILWQVDPELDYPNTVFAGKHIARKPDEEDVNAPELHVHMDVGKIVKDYVVDLSDKPNDEPTLVKVPLDEALIDAEEGIGHVKVFVGPADNKKDTSVGVHTAWIQCTKIGFDSYATSSVLGVWSNSLLDGSPLPETSFSLCIADKEPLTVETDADATACFDNLTKILEKQRRRTTMRLFAKKGKDVTFDDIYFPHFSRRILVHVIDDRNLYKPGETVHCKGWCRALEGSPTARPTCKPLAGLDFSYTLSDARNVEIEKGESKLNEYGAFDLTFSLPGNINLGRAGINFVLEVGDYGRTVHYHNFDVQEFRTPEFSVSAQASSSVKYTNEDTLVSTTAKYYSGGPLESCVVKWVPSASKTTFRPPGVPTRFSFQDKGDFNFGRPYSPPQNFDSISDVTDSNGESHVKVAFQGSSDPPCPQQVTMESQITDINNQQIAAKTSFLVHPCRYYVGIDTCSGGFVDVEKFSPQFIVTDVDGNVLSDVEVTVTLSLKETKSVRGTFKRTVVKKGELTFCSSDDKEGFSLSKEDIKKLDFSDGGNYILSATVYDSETRKNHSSVGFYVPGETVKMPISTRLGADQVTLLADKTDYQPGDVAQILVTCPFVPYEGQWVVTAQDIVKTGRFSVDSSSEHVVEIPIEEELVPRVKLSVSTVGCKSRISHFEEANQEIQTPAYATGSIVLPISTKSRELTVSAVPQQKVVAPGSEVVVDVIVRDFRDSPALDVEVTLIVVDDAVLSLTGYSLSNPLDFFYRDLHQFHLQTLNNRSRVYFISWEDIHIRGRIPIEIYKARFAGGSLARGGWGTEECAMEDSFSTSKRFLPMACLAAVGGGEAPDQNEMIAVRSNFDPLACFEPSVVTDSNGQASVKVTMPDSLTSYRVWAVAADKDGHLFGFTENSVSCQLPLVVRPSPPRFMNFGDTAEIPVVLQNLTDEELEVGVCIRTNQAVLQLNSSKGFTGAIPPMKRAVVSFVVESNDQAGTGHLQIAATADSSDDSVSGYADAIEKEFPVYTPASTEAFATYGEIDEEGAISQRITVPSEVYPQFGGLEATISSSALQGLTDSFLYLYNYPFKCVEQVTSSCMGVLVMWDFMQVFSSQDEEHKAPTAEEMRSYVNEKLQKLKSMQQSDGGFSFWGSRADSSPYLSCYVAHMLSWAVRKAEKIGLEVPEDVIANLLPYLKDIHSHVASLDSHKLRLSIEAYACYASAELGDEEATERAEKLWGESKGVEDFELSSLGWLVMTFSKSASQTAAQITNDIQAFLNNRVNETAETANFISSYTSTTDRDNSRFLLLESNVRTDAVLLQALICTDPTNSLIVKLAKGLLTRKNQCGCWNNTQENVHVLAALDCYFQEFESVEPDFVSRVWFDGLFGGESTFKGFSTDLHDINVPMSAVVDPDPSAMVEEKKLVIQKEGNNGRLYYRVGIKYAPVVVGSPPFSDELDYGFVVHRSYAPVDNDDDVVLDSDTGVWKIKTGATVKVELELINKSRRYHVALVDKLPGGFEPLNPALKTTPAIPPSEDDQVSPFIRGLCWWNRTWYEHQNMRDERVEAFTSLLREGVHKYSYYARATTPGSFTAPSARAEEMYSPEVFGASNSLSVVISH